MPPGHAGGLAGAAQDGCPRDRLGHGEPRPWRHVPRRMTGSVMSAETPIVFVVDDDRSVRDSLRKLIVSVGMTVEVFPTAQAFLSAPRGDAPGCLILDV